MWHQEAQKEAGAFLSFCRGVYAQENPVSSFSVQGFQSKAGKTQFLLIGIFPQTRQMKPQQRLKFVTQLAGSGARKSRGFGAPAEERGVPPGSILPAPGRNSPGMPPAVPPPHTHARSLDTEEDQRNSTIPALFHGWRGWNPQERQPAQGNSPWDVPAQPSSPLAPRNTAQEHSLALSNKRWERAGCARMQKPGKSTALLRQHPELSLPIYLGLSFEPR